MSIEKKPLVQTTQILERGIPSLLVAAQKLILDGWRVDTTKYAGQEGFAYTVYFKKEPNIVFPEIEPTAFVDSDTKELSEQTSVVPEEVVDDQAVVSLDLTAPKKPGRKPKQV